MQLDFEHFWLSLWLLLKLLLLLAFFCLDEDPLVARRKRLEKIPPTPEELEEELEEEGTEEKEEEDPEGADDGDEPERAAAKTLLEA